MKNPNIQNLRNFFILWIIFIYPTSLLGQKESLTDTIPKRFQKFMYRHKYKWTNDALWQTGNVERFLYNTSLQFMYADSMIDYEIKPRFIYGEISQKQNEQVIKGIVQEREQSLDLHLGLLSQKRFYGFGFGVIEKSNLRKIEFRWQAGVGVGWHVIKTQNNHHKLNLTVALLHEETNFINPSQPDYQIFRASLRLKGTHQFFDNHLKFSHTTTFLPSLAFDNNKRLISNLALEIPISKRIQLRGSFDLTYEGIVPANIQNTDTRTQLGLVITNF
jgi:hypothetical protein